MSRTEIPRPESLLTRSLRRWGGLVAGRPLAAVVGFLLALVIVGAAAVGLGGKPHDEYAVDGLEATTGIEMIAERMPTLGNASATLVVHGGGTVDRATLAAFQKDLRAVPHVAQVSTRAVSDDGETAVVDVAYSLPVDDSRITGTIEPLEKASVPTEDKGFDVDITGNLASTTAQDISGIGEVVGVIAALFVLLFTLRSVRAAGLPILTAVLGLLMGMGLGYVLASVVSISTSAPTVAAMVGLGVGLDYCLLIVVRLMNYRRSGLSPQESAASATATAGHAVVFAGLTVLLSLTGLTLSGLPIFITFAYTTALAVLAAMASALTLGPSLGCLLARRIEPDPDADPEHEAATSVDTLSARWARRVVEKPVRWIVVALAILTPLIVPIIGMHTWPQDANNQTTNSTGRRAEDAMVAAFGPGFNATILAVSKEATPQEAQTFRTEAADLPHVQRIDPVPGADRAGLTLLRITPDIQTSDPATPDLVQGLRAIDVGGMYVTGDSVINQDIAQRLKDRLPLVMAFVITTATILLGLIYRSVAVPLKAAAMNMLSIGAAYGATRMVFQEGWGRQLLGIDHDIPVSSYVLILMFTILFGLSMDYEVFILSRVKEEYDRTGDPLGSITDGLAATAKVVTAAAAVMVAVFAGFSTEHDVIVKQMGVGMAVAVLVDATVIRLLLVPSTMAVLGRWNWWPGGHRKAVGHTG